MGSSRISLRSLPLRLAMHLTVWFGTPPSTTSTTTHTHTHTYKRTLLSCFVCSAHSVAWLPQNGRTVFPPPGSVPVSPLRDSPRPPPFARSPFQQASRVEGTSAGRAPEVGLASARQGGPGRPAPAVTAGTTATATRPPRLASATPGTSPPCVAS